MPLSEHEQRLLEQMERALSAEDPKFASALRGSSSRGSYRRRLLAATAAFLLGVTLLIAGALTEPLISVVGFLFMLTAVWLAVSTWRSSPPAGALPAGGHPAPNNVTPLRKGRSRGGLLARFEQRWDRRRDERGQ